MRKETRCTTCNKPIHKDCAIKGCCDTCYTANKKPATVPLETIPNVIRRSYIETYRTCPFKFYMQVLKGIREEMNPYQQVGIDLHEIFNLCSKNHAIQHETALEMFEEYWYNYPLALFGDEPQLKNKLYDRGIESINTYFYKIRSMPRAISTEQTLHTSIGDSYPTIETTLDRINPHPEGLEIVDWKTGNVMVGKKFTTDLQAPLYINAVNSHYEEKVKIFRLIYLQENKERIFERVDDNIYCCTVGKRDYIINIDEKIKEVKQIFNNINKGVFNVPRNNKDMYFNCKMCYLRKQDMCKGADIQSWRI